MLLPYILKNYLDPELGYAIVVSTVVLVILLGIGILLVSFIIPKSNLVHTLHSRLYGSDSGFDLNSVRLGGIFLIVAAFISFAIFPMPESVRLSIEAREKVEAQDRASKEAARIRAESIEQADKARADAALSNTSVQTSAEPVTAADTEQEFRSECDSAVKSRYSRLFGLDYNDINVQTLGAYRKLNDGSQFIDAVVSSNSDSQNASAVCAKENSSGQLIVIEGR